MTAKQEKPRPWPPEKRKRFVELLDASLAAGETYEEIAKALDLASTRSLRHEWRYSKERRPGPKTIKRACLYWNVMPWEIDETEEGGVDAIFGNQMGILGSEISPEWKTKLIEMAKLAQADGIAKRESEARIKKLRPKG